MDMDDRLIVTGSKDQTVRLWDKKTGECKGVLKGHKDWIKDVKIRGDYILSVASNHTFYVWDRHSGREIYSQTFFSKKSANFLKIGDNEIIGAYPNGQVRKFSFAQPTSPLMLESTESDEGKEDSVL